jgi:phenylpropionate dioxygenase-like ring-hydroxylating dioxygenase large terminal subunit
MLLREENELLTRVGPGTPTGALFRRYWLPACLSEEIPTPDSPPVRVRLLGEDLVAFRDRDGRVGLLGEHCSHRRASLFYGRVEEGGLTCIYHGWKYDTDGRILETPAEPAHSMIKHHVRHTAYPCHEANGIVFAYMGPRERMPLFPAYEWLTVPEDHVHVNKMINECNYLQAIEGDCDSAHRDYLHRRGAGLVLDEDGAPTFELETTSWGVTAQAIRRVGEDCKYVRTNIFIAPCLGCVPVGRVVNGVLDGLTAVYQVPADDVMTTRYHVGMRRSGPMPQENQERWGRGEVGPDFRKLAHRRNDYLIDREKQRTSVYCGIDFGNNTQDACVTETMGAVCDRTQEHLGVADTHIIALRQFLLGAVRGFEQGQDPPGLVFEPAQNDFSDVYCVNVTVPADRPVSQLTRDGSPVSA